MTVATARPVRTASLRVALLKPNLVFYPRSLSAYGPIPPVGLAYVAGALRAAGHEVQVLDTVGEAIERSTDFDSPVGRLRRVGMTSEKAVARLHPKTAVVGLTNMFLHEWPVTRELAEAVRERFPEATIVLGGENATSFWPWIFEQTTAVDHVVLGEGEATMVAVATALQEGRSVEDIPGVESRVGRGERTTARAPRLRNLDELARPAWDLFPIDEYQRFADFHGVHRGRSMTVLATRGCPYQCTFCSAPAMWTTRYVVRDPDEVADEIADYVRRWGITNVNFADLTAITKRNWTLRFCDALDARVPGITWQLPVGTRAEALDSEVLQRLWDTGCRNITYAPESGSRRMLEIYRKGVDLEQILTSLRAAHRLRIVTRINIIIGHPDERWSDLLRSLWFMVRAARAGANDAAVMIFGPYPGSVDFDRLVLAGEVVVDDAYTYVALARASAGATSYNARFSSGQLKAALLVMLGTFYTVGHLLHPGRLRHLLRWRRDREESALDQWIRIKRRGYRPLGDASMPSERVATG